MAGIISGPDPRQTAYYSENNSIAPGRIIIPAYFQTYRHNQDGQGSYSVIVITDADKAVCQKPPLCLDVLVYQNRISVRIDDH